MILGVRGLVINSENRVLLVRHTYVNGFLLPRGGVDRGESLIKALGRVFREGRNISFLENAGRLHSVYVNSYVCSYDSVVLFVVR
jgi:hypothetical protein